MMTMQLRALVCGGILALSLATIACSPAETPTVGSGEPLERIVELGLEDDVLVRVNGHPITQYDLNLWQLAEGKQQLARKEQDALMDRIVEAELLYQKGVELGLDKDPVFHRAMALAEAKVKLLRRQEMERRLRQNAAEAIQVSDAEAQAYYTKNENVIRTTYHLGSLQFATEKEAKAVLARIRKGESFEDVANEAVRSMPGVAPGQELRPLWDMGFVTWRQIPPPIMDVVRKLKPGKVSSVIAHQPAGYIVLKLFEKGTLEEADFPSVRQEIIARLKDQAAEKRFEQYRRELRASAQIEKVAAPQLVNMAPARSFH